MKENQKREARTPNLGPTHMATIKTFHFCGTGQECGERRALARSVGNVQDTLSEGNLCLDSAISILEIIYNY